MNCYYATIRSLDEITAYCNLSRSHLSRLFHQHLQTSLQDYLIQIRLNKARALLLDSELPIHEIAIQVGYQNELNLLRAFRTKLKLFPSEYRKKYKL